MSLRIFHVVFIVVCIALSIFVGIWGIQEFAATKSRGAAGLSIVFFASAAALIVYGARVFGKLRDLD